MEEVVNDVRCLMPDGRCLMSEGFVHKVLTLNHRFTFDYQSAMAAYHVFACLLGGLLEVAAGGMTHVVDVAGGTEVLVAYFKNRHPGVGGAQAAFVGLFAVGEDAFDADKEVGEVGPMGRS